MNIIQIITFVLLAILSFILIAIYSYKFAIFLGVMVFIIFIKGILAPYSENSINNEKILISINEITSNEKIFAYIFAILGNIFLIILFFSEQPVITWIIIIACLFFDMVPFMNAYRRYIGKQKLEEYQEEFEIQYNYDDKMIILK